MFWLFSDMLLYGEFNNVYQQYELHRKIMLHEALIRCTPAPQSPHISSSFAALVLSLPSLTLSISDSTCPPFPPPVPRPVLPGVEHAECGMIVQSKVKSFRVWTK